MERYHEHLLTSLSEEQWRPVVSVRSSSRSDPAVGLRTLIATEHYILEEDEAHRVAVLRRTPVPFKSIDEIVESNDRVLEQLKPYHAGYGAIVDMRQAPPRNDPSFENAMSRLRNRVTEVFARVAVLLESSVGVLQVDRLGRAEGGKTFATQSEAAATRFARGQA